MGLGPTVAAPENKIALLQKLKTKGKDLALIACDECGAMVSDKASACVKCGAPLNTGMAPLARADGKVVTTQQTGKKYKGLQLLGVGMVCAGVVSCTAKEPIVASGLLMVGLLVFLGARIGAWWNHG